MTTKLKIVHGLAIIVFLVLLAFSTWGAYQYITLRFINFNLTSKAFDLELDRLESELELCPEDDSDLDNQPLAAITEIETNDGISTYRLSVEDTHLKFKIDDKWVLESVMSGGSESFFTPRFSYTDTTQYYENALNPGEPPYPRYWLGFYIGREDSGLAYSSYLFENKEDLPDGIESVTVAGVEGIKVLDMEVAPGWAGPVYLFKDNGFVFSVGIGCFCTGEQSQAIEEEFEEFVRSFRLEDWGE